MIGAESLAAQVKFLIFILAILLAIFLIVIVKNIKNKNLSVKQKWMLTLITPILILLGALTSNLTGEKDVNLFVFLFLIIVNLSYISKPITDLFSELIYDGNNRTINLSLFLLLSMVITFAELAGAFAIFILLIKN